MRKGMFQHHDNKDLYILSWRTVMADLATRVFCEVLAAWCFSKVRQQEPLQMMDREVTAHKVFQNMGAIHTIKSGRGTIGSSLRDMSSVVKPSESR